MLSTSMSKTLPLIRRNGACHQLIVDGEPFILLAAEMQNSSASNLQYMERHHCWERLVAYNCNAALVPLYWDMIEPEEGQFDLSLVDGIITAARKYGLRLVLLWFGTWKNATSSYAPAYVKTDMERFPRRRLANGLNSQTISPFSEHACQADSRALVRVMEHIRQVDADRQTVLAIQIENEIGVPGGDRDRSAEADRQFGDPVPRPLLEHLRREWDDLHPTLASHVERSTLETGGTWTDVFAAMADEVFMAWHFARYVDRIAAAGKEVIPLPMFVNACLEESNRPGEYPWGGPAAKLIDVWRPAAPHIDAIAPDIYFADFKGICAEFARPWNPMIVPESAPRPAARQAFWVIAECKGICFSPFGIDHPHCWPQCGWQSDGLAETYALLREMMPVVTAAQAEGRIRGVLQMSADESEACTALGDYEMAISYLRNDNEAARPPAAGMILQFGEDEFVVAGHGFSVCFTLTKECGGQADFLWAEQGYFEAGQWIAERRLNGDDTWGCSLRLPAGPGISCRRAKIYRYL